MEERLYDLIFIVRPATPEDEIKKVIADDRALSCAEKIRQDRENRAFGAPASLAYRVAKHREGIYVYQQIRTNHGELIHETGTPASGVQDNVIKYLTVRLRLKTEAPEESSVIAVKRRGRAPSAPHPIDSSGSATGRSTKRPPAPSAPPARASGPAS